MKTKVNAKHVDESIFKIDIQHKSGFRNKISNGVFSWDNNLNRASLELILEQDDDASFLINDSIVLPYHGLDRSATINVSIKESTSNGREPNTHQEVGINIEKPIEDTKFP